MNPIKPDEVQSAKNKAIPDEVIKVFNDLIVKNWNGSSATIKQDEVMNLIVGALGLTKNEVFKRKLLDVEDVFRSAGWNVIYDKPGYCETYPASFTFSVAKK